MGARPIGRRIAPRAHIGRQEELVWYRLGAGSSDRQWLDVKGLIEVQGNDLDRAYLDQWARHLGVEDLLERSLAEAVAKR